MDQPFRCRSIARVAPLLCAAIALLGCAASRSADPRSTSRSLERELPAPKVIFFDVNETLLDLETMRASVGDALGGRRDLLPLWFSTMLHHSLVDNATGRYHNFGEIGVAALLMVAESNGIDLTEAEAREAIVTPLRSLPPHPDVEDGLRELKEQGFTLVSLTNSSNAGVLQQFENAGLLGYFDQRLSIEDIRLYKPNRDAYRWAAKRMGVEPAEAMLVAAHGWDIAGAKAAGFQAAFVARPGKVLYPLADPPDLVVTTIPELARELAGR
jgi:2-haloacid dehalogenase